MFQPSKIMNYQKFLVHLRNYSLFQMATEVKRVLFVNSEMCPYLPDSPIALSTRTLAQGIQEKRVEIRSFMPRYGLINERKNQLHEVIRLSGINIITDDVDRPLVIKVASLPSARMQVYFIDNDDFFRRKALYRDAEGKCFKDNGERAIFFARGVLETVKKLRWSPDIIHCSGWITHLLPLYLKKCYKDDPIFSSSKVVLSLFDDIQTEPFEDNLANLTLFQSIEEGDVSLLDKPAGINLAKLAVEYSDGVLMADENVPEELCAYAKAKGLPVLDYDRTSVENGSFVDRYHSFYTDL